MMSRLIKLINKLEQIADGECFCEKVEGYDRCLTCRASGMLNELCEIADYNLEELGIKIPRPWEKQSEKVSQDSKYFQKR